MIKINKRCIGRESVNAALVLTIIFLVGESFGLYLYKNFEPNTIERSMFWLAVVYIIAQLFSSGFASQGYFITYNKNFGYVFGVFFGTIFMCRFSWLFGISYGAGIVMAFLVKNINYYKLLRLLKSEE